MSATKARISVTIVQQVAQMLDDISKTKGLSKSAVAETALRRFFEDQLVEDVKKMSTMTFDDLPSEEDWLVIQNETLK